MNLNELMIEKGRLKARLTELRNEEKDLKKAEEDIDRQIFSDLDNQGLSRTANDDFSVSINVDTVADVQDWDTVYEYLFKTGDFSLLHKRISAAAYKEILKLGESVPGLQPREIRRLNFRSL